MAIFRGEATSAPAGFHAGPPSWSNWNLAMLVFVEGGKPEPVTSAIRVRCSTNWAMKPHIGNKVSLLSSRYEAGNKVNLLRSYLSWSPNIFRLLLSYYLNWKFTAMIILHFDLQLQFKYMNFFIYTSHHLNSTYIWHRATLVGHKRSHHCTIPAPQAGIAWPVSIFL